MVLVERKQFEKALEEYLNNVMKIHEQETSTEQSYYTALSNFLSDIYNVPRKNILVNPVEKWGMPDFVILNQELIVGYIEAKAPTINLLPILESEQLKRYIDAFPNVCLTNFTEFIFIQPGVDPKTIKLVSNIRFTKKDLTDIPKAVLSRFHILLEEFLLFSSPLITNVEKLTKRLSRLTFVMKEIFISHHTKEKDIFTHQSIENLFNGFKTSLIENISRVEFCDILAQTISYSLLLAVAHHKVADKNNTTLTLSTVWQDIPKSIPILVELYTQFMVKMPKNVELCCNSIIQLLNKCDFNLIFAFFDEHKDDPTIYFYENFLASYNPSLKKLKGVFYTPTPIVRYMISSVDEILINFFNKNKGLMDDSVYLLDPCAGTATFIIEAIKQIFGKLANARNLGLFKGIVKEHILKHFFAFEIMITAYAIGHFKLRNFLKSLQYPLESKDFFQLYLTNTLETKAEDEGLTGFFALSEEGRKANIIKKTTPILTIVGNPPYKIGSTNKSSSINKLMIDYRPKKKKQRENLQPLSDDYIKFIRFAQWKIAEKNNEGIVAFITNNNFLKGRIHRKMRHSLLKSFDKILILDLHGDAREERPPKNTKNESVFGIQTGVCIFFLIKLKNSNKDNEELAEVYYSEVWGSAKEKLSLLGKNDIIKMLNDKKLKRIHPYNPYFFLFPYYVSKQMQQFWDSFFTIREDIFHVASIGVQTSRDKLSIALDEKTLFDRFTEIRNSNLSTSEIIAKNEWGQWKGDDWTENRIKSYLTDLRRKEKNGKVRPINDYIRKIHYRPFDFQYVFYMDGFVQITCRERAEHLKGNSSGEIALIIGRSGRPSKYSWDMVIMTSEMPDQVLVTYRGSSILCPMNYKKSTDTKTLSSNIRTPFLLNLKNHYLRENSVSHIDNAEFPRNVMYYLYGILYSMVYRKKWEEFLKYDMPRFPFPKNYHLFSSMSEKGELLAKMHMFYTDLLSDTMLDEIKFPVQGINVITKIRYVKEKEQLWINKEQYFTGVSERIWNYRIGGYQVLKQWLNRRINRELVTQDIKHLRMMIYIINQTIKSSVELDNIYLEIEKDSISSKIFRTNMDYYI